uniref:Uncharacterized protein n=1 Tax=Engystomops pustulosus TaxID=76066 RepID=A0AAV6YVY3_ENGPU|nr:hypothetical protein GDO81_023308 [Engystomops pustulosus]
MLNHQKCKSLGRCINKCVCSGKKGFRNVSSMWIFSSSVITSHSLHSSFTAAASITQPLHTLLIYTGCMWPHSLFINEFMCNF